MDLAQIIWDIFILSVLSYNQYVHIKLERKMFENYQIKESKMAYTVDTKVGDILKDADLIVGILQKDIPLLGVVKEMTLKNLLDLPQIKQLGVTEAMVKQVLAQINAKK
jgi:hypothetical protein